jgi:23S rRNA (adenine2503-C2)-methyltransferase
VRNQLVPLNRKYPLEDLLGACRRYLQSKTRKESITFEYVMLNRVNDQPEHARQLIACLSGIRAKVNLIPFNQFENSGYERSPQPVIDRFFDILAAAGIRVTMRRPRGEDIQAACGQLAGRVDDRAHRGQHYVRLYQQSKLERKITTPCV